MVKTRTALAAVAGIGLLSAVVARAQEAGQHAPPSWDTLVKCAVMPNEDARLACYDAAMRAAGYAPKPEAVAAEKRRRFGLSIPQIGVLKKHGKEEGQEVASKAAPPAAPGEAAAPAAPPPPPDDENKVSVELSQVATVQPNNRLILFTSDGAIWEQTDDTQVSSYPKAGQTITIRRGVMGGYMCDVTKSKSVRCKRDR